MSKEDAIKLLEESLRQKRPEKNSISEFLRKEGIKTGVKNTRRQDGILGMASAALCAKQFLRDRSRFYGCEMCSEVGKTVFLTITEGEDESKC